MLVLFGTISLFASVSSKKSGKMVPNPYSKQNLARNVTGRNYSNDLYLGDNGNSTYADNDTFITEDSLQKILDTKKSKSVEASSLSLLTNDTFKVEKVIVIDEEGDVELNPKELKDQMILDSLMDKKEKQLDSLSNVDRNQKLEKAKKEELLTAQNDKKVKKVLFIILIVIIVALILNGRLSSVEEKHKNNR